VAPAWRHELVRCVCGTVTKVIWNKRAVRHIHVNKHRTNINLFIFSTECLSCPLAIPDPAVLHEIGSTWIESNCYRKCFYMFSLVKEIYFISSRYFYIPQLACKTTALIGVVVKLRKATASFVMSVFLFVCLSAWNDSAPNGRIFMKLDIWVFRKSFKKIQFSWKSDNNNDYFNEHMCTFITTYHPILHRMRNI
jgi:hypothetical protein